MNQHETFQMFCRYCYRKFESPTREGALAAVEEHEQQKKEGQPCAKSN